MIETKTLKLIDCELKLDGKDNRFGGYASVFNGVDSYNDTILPGAYKQTLEKNGLPKMFFNHKSYDLPPGKWLEAKEDSKGLALVGEFTEGMTLANDLRKAVQHETIDGLSIGYRLSKDDYTKKDDGGKEIKNVSYLGEVSLVTFPADKAARVSFKSEIEEIESIRDLERFLRDVGVSKSEAVTLISKAKSIFGEQKDDKPDFSALINRINNFKI